MFQFIDEEAELFPGIEETSKSMEESELSLWEQNLNGNCLELFNNISNCFNEIIQIDETFVWPGDSTKEKMYG